MAPSKAQRLQLYEELVKKFGDEPAMTLMESLPPVDWHELATKDDLAALEERVNARFEVVDARIDTGLGGVRGEVAALRVELGARIDTGLAGVRGEIGEMRGEMRGEIGEMRGEMSAMNARFEVVDARFDAVGDRIDKGLADLRGEMKLDMARLTRDMARQTYVILAGLVAIITPIYIALFTGAAG